MDNMNLPYNSIIFFLLLRTLPHLIYFITSRLDASMAEFITFVFLTLNQLIYEIKFTVGLKPKKFTEC